MTLGNMRENGVRTLDGLVPGARVQSPQRGRRGRAPRRRPRAVYRTASAMCSGHLGADARPNWSEYRAPGMGR